MGIYLRRTLRQTSGLNVTKDWKNPRFPRVGTVFPHQRFLLISGTPLSVGIASGRSLRDGILVQAVEEITTVFLYSVVASLM